jgi:hypothetical protein
MAEIANDVTNNKKCYNCGKLFRTPANLLRHRNRKTPCLIREVSQADLGNPNRCIFCNKILSKKEHLTRHMKTCKIKNGGMDILVDKVRYEQEIRILKEKDQEKEKQIKLLTDRVEKMESNVVVSNAAASNINNTNNNTINNYNAPVQNIQIIINNYATPTIAGLQITADELNTITTKLSKFLLQKMYFNPELPQNHCIYLVNKKDKSLLVHGDKWEIVMGDNLEDVIRKLKDTVYTKGGDLINGKEGPYNGKDDHFLKLSGANQERIIQFNRIADILTPDDAYEAFLGGRDIVLETIRAAGCKLV